MSGQQRLFINGRFLTQATTGVQRYARECLRALDKLVSHHVLDQWHVEVLAPPSGVMQLALSSIAVRKVGILSGNLWEQIQLPFHARGGVLLSLGNAAPMVLRSQCVTIHDAAPFSVGDAYSYSFRTWYRILLPTLGRRAERIVTDSEFSRQELARRAGIPVRKIRVVPLGVDHMFGLRSDDTILARYQLAERPFLLSVSSQSRHKNLGTLAQAMNQIGSRDWDLVIVGGHSPNFSAVLTEWPERVKYVGYVSDSELCALYKRATCFVFPSLYEGFGLPPLEAMACGCPVIVSRAGALPEVCGDVAMYCDPLDPADLARCINTVMKDPSAQRHLRDRGVERAHGFTWERTAKGLIEVLDEMRSERALGMAQGFSPTSIDPI